MKPIVLLVGKSGVGKNYIANAFNMRSLPSFTTREKREGETDGVEHIFVKFFDWEALYGTYKYVDIVAKTHFDGNYYWSTLAQLEDEQYDVYIIDPAGVRYFIENFSTQINRSYSVVYTKTSLLKRIKHMKQRKDPWKKVIKRLLNDYKEFSGFEKDKTIPKIVIEV